MTWPTKTDFVDGDVLTAAQVNNIGTNLNEADPTGITDGYVLTADGAGSMGWEALPASGGGYTELSSGTFTNGLSSHTVTGYSLDYKHLEVWLYNFTLGAAQYIAVRPQYNSLENFSGGSYVYSSIRNTNTSVSAAGGNGTADFMQLEFGVVGLIGGNSTNYIKFTIPNYSVTENMKYCWGTMNFWNNSGQNSSLLAQSALYRNTAAPMDTFRVFTSGGTNIGNMKYRIWGID